MDDDVRTAPGYEADPWLAASMAWTFLRGVGRQGRRLLRLPFPKSPEEADALRFEEHLFVVTAHQAGVWVNAAFRQGAIRKKACQPYRSLRPEIREIRDMREHGDEYLRGKGDHQKRFVHHDEERNLKANGSSSIVTDEGHELGLRVTVERFIQVAEQALPAVEAAAEPLLDDEHDD